MHFRHTFIKTRGAKAAAFFVLLQHRSVAGESIIKKTYIMKKILSFSILIVLFVSVFSQTVTLTFTGRDANNNWVQLDHVVITDLTRN